MSNVPPGAGRVRPAREAAPRPEDVEALHAAVLGWYDRAARDLPWRRPEATAWGVLVSEVMLQQTPVSRVLPVWSAWVERWPTPADLAAAPAGEAVRMWGRLGYPRRALRLHQAATAVVLRHDGRVPDDLDALRALPGVGEYTAAAVASFAFGQRYAVLDTNVRRVLARLVGGVEQPPPALTTAERSRAWSMVPDDPATASSWAVGVMELGALVCTATGPRCGECPVADRCRWQRAGCPPYDGPLRRGQTYAGTDRQCRGRLLDVLRADPHPVPRRRIEAAWHLPEQRERCLSALVEDGLVVPVPPDRYALP